MAKYYDFDKFMKESEKEPIGMKVEGDIYYLPEIKAKLVMGKLLKLASAKTDEEKANMLDEDTMKDVVGEDNYKTWMSKGVSMRKLKAIVFVAMQIMGEGLSEEVDINSIDLVDDKKK